MTITPEQIAITAGLAKLKIDGDDAIEVAKRIGAILELVDQMQAVDTSNVEPMANSLDAVQRLRADDAIRPENPIETRDALQQIAPAIEDGLFLVPKVIDWSRKWSTETNRHWWTIFSIYKKPFYLQI